MGPPLYTGLIKPPLVVATALGLFSQGFPTAGLEAASLRLGSSASKDS
jgi:hypothetical protein